MKFALHLHEIEDIEKMYNLVIKANPPYEMIKYDDIKDWESAQLNRNYFAIDPPEFGSLRPALTTEGICQAWIPYDVENPFHQSKFIDLFEEIFNKSVRKVSSDVLQSKKLFRFIGYESNYISNIIQASYR